MGTTWIESWDRQQERYVADREERFTVIGDVLAHRLADTPRPVVLDLGCGPGSLAARLVRALPAARVIGVDSDPLLLSLGREAYPEVEFVDADLNEADWAVGLPSTVDAAVSTTALHWLPPQRLAAMYTRLAELLRPGGVFVNGDHLSADSPALQELALHVRERRAERVGVTGHQEWESWWADVAADEALRPLLAERTARRQRVASGDDSAEAHLHHGSNALSAAGHAERLRAAGFQAVGPVWQSGDDQVLVAIR